MTSGQGQGPARRGLDRDGNPIPDIGIFLDAVVGDAKEWVEGQKEHTTLELSERLGRMAGTLMVLIVTALLLAGVLLMGTVSLAIWAGGIFGSTALGFLLVSGIYLVLFLLFMAFGRKDMRDQIMLYLINATRDEDPVS